MSWCLLLFHVSAYNQEHWVLRFPDLIAGDVFDGCRSLASFTFFTSINCYVIIFTALSIHVGLTEAVKKRVHGYGAEWIASIAGLEWRRDGEVLDVQERTVTLLKADVTSQQNLALAKAGVSTELEPSNFAMIDCPYGCRRHLSSSGDKGQVLQCDRDWDEEAWTGQQLSECLDASKASGLLADRHCLVFWTPQDKIGYFTKVLEDLGYTPPQVVQWVKTDCNR